MELGNDSVNVKTLQKALIKKGYVLPRFGADGDFGSETWATLFNYAEAHGLHWDVDDFEAEEGKVPPAVVAHVLAPLELSTGKVSATGAPQKDRKFADVTGKHPLLKGRRKARDPETVHTIVLHQTAIKFGTTARNRKRLGARGALHERFHNVGCHVAALTNGDVLYVNRLPAYVWHAHVANRFSVGIEIEGLYAGIAGKANTVWRGKKPTKLTDTTIDAARRAVRFTYEEGLRLGMPLTWIQPHRAFSKSRRSDPGEELWREVGVWACDELGLRVNYDLRRNGGLPVPREWDDKAVFDYRGRAVKS
ncbi:MAG: N-acetylmuramoyl-L-alanine amidase [Myxococcota bacterium]